MTAAPRAAVFVRQESRLRVAALKQPLTIFA
jgi:hypothetical protein